MRWRATSLLTCRCMGVLALLLLPVSAAAVAIPHGTVDLISEHASIQPGRPFQLGLKFQLEKGWHIYWINPGDAGQPPRVKWDLPQGFSAGEILWPYPHQLPTFTLMDFGYEDEVLLMIPIKTAATLKNSGQAVIRGDLRIIICKDVCISGKAQLSLSLPVRADAPAASATKADFDSTRAKIPVPAPKAWKLSAANRNDSFYLTASLGRPVKEAFFFPLEDSQIENAAPQTIQTLKKGFAVELKKSNRLTQPVQRLKGVLQMGNKAYVIDVPVK